MLAGLWDGNILLHVNVVFAKPVPSGGLTTPRNELLCLSLCKNQLR